MVTGSARDVSGGQGYFRLHVNQYGTVETVTCYTSQVSEKNPTFVKKGPSNVVEGESWLFLKLFAMCK